MVVFYCNVFSNSIQEFLKNPSDDIESIRGEIYIIDEFSELRSPEIGVIEICFEYAKTIRKAFDNPGERITVTNSISFTQYIQFLGDMLIISDDLGNELYIEEFSQFYNSVRSHCILFINSFQGINNSLDSYLLNRLISI